MTHYVIGRPVDFGILVVCPICDSKQVARQGPGRYHCSSDDCTVQIVVIMKPTTGRRLGLGGL